MKCKQLKKTWKKKDFTKYKAIKNAIKLQTQFNFLNIIYFEIDTKWNKLWPTNVNVTNLSIK